MWLSNGGKGLGKWDRSHGGKKERENMETMKQLGRGDTGPKMAGKDRTSGE